MNKAITWVLTGALALMGFILGSLVLVPIGLHFYDRWDYFGPFGGGLPGLVGCIASMSSAVAAALIPRVIRRSRRKS